MSLNIIPLRDRIIQEDKTRIKANYILYPHQVEAKESVLNAFNCHDRCHVVMACGTGKTLTALSIAENMNVKSIVIFVPSLALINQFMKEWLRNHHWPNVQTMCVCSDKTVTDNIEEESILLEEINFPVNTNPLAIRQFLNTKYNGIKIIFCTYQSATLLEGLNIDFGIFDEAHKTAGYNKLTFSYGLNDKNITIKKRLFMTATPRHGIQRKNKKGELKTLYSMDDKKIYGPRAYTLTFRQAINLGLICDYKVIISVIDNKKKHKFNERYELQEKAISLNKAIEASNAKKVISFHSTIDNAQNFSNYYQKNAPKGFNILHISAKSKIENRSKTMELFRESKKSLISNARCLTEGIDVPTIDMVAFLNPKKSKIDIVQAIGRALRNAPGKKVGYVFLPLFIEDDNLDKIKDTQYSSIWDILNSLMEHDTDLEDIVKNLAKKQGTTGDKTKKISEFIQILTPNKKLNDLISAKILEEITPSWFLKYAELIKYKEKYGNCNVPDWRSNQQHKILAHWVHTQRVSKRLNRITLTEEKEKLLNDIGFSWNIIDENWQLKYNELEEYYKKFGTSKVNSTTYRTLNKWLSSQKRAYHLGKLSKERQEKLDLLNADYKSDMIYLDSWKTGLKRLKEYFKKYGFKKTNFHGIDLSNDKDRYLIGWIGFYRKQYKEGILSKDKLNTFKKLKISLDPLDTCWHETFKLYKKLLKEGKPTKKLASWCNIQRKNFKKGTLLADRIKLLESIDFVFDTTEDPRFKKALNRFIKYKDNKNKLKKQEIKQMESWILATRYKIKSGKKNFSKKYFTELKKAKFPFKAEKAIK